MAERAVDRVDGKMPPLNVRNRMIQIVRLPSAHLVWFAGTLFWAVILGRGVVQADVDFKKEIAPILQNNCLTCHNSKTRKGQLSLENIDDLLENETIVVGNADDSHLISQVVPVDGKAEMPKQGKPLSDSEVALLRRWINEGANWPKSDQLKYDPSDWWSLNPIKRPPLPEQVAEDISWARNPIDRFVASARREKGLGPTSEADRRTLVRRLYFDLLGLPPSIEEVEEFCNDPDQSAYEKLVDKLLDSKHYGERWARHWLDLVHYGDTHGYDKDKLRNNAWPYRDYVIRSFNDDKPYDQFVREQLAGDVLAPFSSDAIIATGFIAAGPFDWVGQIELAEGTRDKRITRNLDRDDMVSVSMNTFVSLTAQCARCHDHKFDPILQRDYYELQAVFAGVDRADRPYDTDPKVAERRKQLESQRKQVAEDLAATEKAIGEQAGERLSQIDKEIAKLKEQASKENSPQFGYHSKIETKATQEKWVQVDLGESYDVSAVVLAGCHDDYNNIGGGFGFPVRFKVSVSDQADFEKSSVIVDKTANDFDNPGVEPQKFSVTAKGRYVRVTATRLVERSSDYIFAIAELQVLSSDGMNLAAGKNVTSLDSVEAPIRWARKNLVDDIYPGREKSNAAEKIVTLEAERSALITQRVDDQLLKSKQSLTHKQAELDRSFEQLPKRSMVYAAATNFNRQGNFKPTRGATREIRVLNRGDVDQPIGDQVSPGTVDAVRGLEASFESAETEGQRRVALANWIVDHRNPLTWRSIVNRVWQYHFSRGIVSTPNDFGRMGVAPSHPELLDWLSIEFRDGGDWIKNPKSIKQLHRLLVTSSVYRQSSRGNPASDAIDAGNQFLWRMNRRRLEAEAVRDATLAVSGVLDRKLYGPGFRAFELEKPQHSPHYLYGKYDPSKSESHRRTIYRFIVRSVPDPFMEVLDCADPSQMVAQRSETITPLSALALLNDPFMVEMSKRFAQRAKAAAESPKEQLRFAWRAAFARDPEDAELLAIVEHAKSHGLENACRLIFNTNEFVFVD